MDRLRRSYNMVMFLLSGLICGISARLLAVPLLTPILYVISFLFGIAFLGLALSSIEKSFSN